MPSSQVTSTPRIIQQAWNDGLYSLREKRNGVARGTSIEEKAMYVLGLGWKFRGNAEVKDKEVENTLYVSLQGLTQESKFLKIGQVLWEQCDEAFILKMITSLANTTPAQSRIYQQIALKERQNFKGYFSKASMISISQQNIDPHSILNRESRQLNQNTFTSQKNREAIAAEKKRLTEASISSKKLDRRVVRFRPANAEIKKLADELTVILRTTESNNIPELAINLGIEVESGFNKKFLTEEIIQVVCTYVEKELLVSRSGVGKASSNVYLRQSQDGLDTIKRLLRYTRFGLMVSDDLMSINDLNNLNNSIEIMRKNMALGSKKGKFSLKRLDRAVSKKDKFLSAMENTESGAISGGKLKGAVKVKSRLYMKIYEFLSSKLNGGESGNFEYVIKEGKVKTDADAVGYWVDFNKTDIKMAMNIVANDANAQTSIRKLKFLRFNSEELLEQLIMLYTSMGIEKTSLTTIATSEAGSMLDPNSPGLYLTAIIRRLIAFDKEENRFGVLGFGRRGRKKQAEDIMAKFDSNLANAREEKKKNDKMFAIGADGSHSPLAIGPTRLKNFYDDMQPVYVVGGSVYAFNQGGFSSMSGDKTPKEAKEIIEQQIERNKKFSMGAAGVEEAYKASLAGENMGAFGTQMAPIDMGKLKGHAALNKLVQSKMMRELQDRQIKVRPDVQPVFLVNQGVNTSNLEVTALLNLIPSILNVIPGIGTAAGMAFSALMQSQIDAARNLPKFARGGSFSTKNVNSNISQFISGDSINNKINPERVTIDWATQRVNVQPLNNTTNNVTNVEAGRISDPIMGTSTTVKVNSKSGKPSEAVNVVNAINPFEETIDSSGITATPMEVLISLKESLVDILTTLGASGQVSQANAQMTAKVVDAINALNDTMSKNSGSSGTNLFGNIGKLARGE